MIGDQEGDTPLHYCEKVDAAQFLLQAGADKEAKNREGKTVRTRVVLIELMLMLLVAIRLSTGR